MYRWVDPAEDLLEELTPLLPPTPGWIRSQALWFRAHRPSLRLALLASLTICTLRELLRLFAVLP